MTSPRHSREGGNPVISGNPVIDHLGLWSSVYVKKATTGRGSNRKISPYGIQKLRELILELAVRGKLVSQDPDDEPASVLLGKIAEEKERLAKEGKIKKQKLLQEPSDDEFLFKLPEGWEWSVLRNICILENGDRSKNYPNKSLLVDAGVPFVNAGHLQNGRINKEEMTFITEERFNLLKAGKFSDGDILFCLRGSLGKSAIVEGFNKGAIASSLVIIRLFSNLDCYYFHNYFDSPFSYSLIKLYDNGTAQPNLSAADLGKFVVPLPPLKEQHRIVAKVDELMALCDQLEQQQTDSLQAHQTLVETLLRTLVDAGDAQSTQQAWNRIAEHFDTLFTTEAFIDHIKQTILQLAVMGKLVPQDLSDQPATELLEKISAEKAQLVKDGKVKKQKALPPIEESEKPFELPEGWDWVRLGDFSYVFSGNSFKSEDFNDQGGVRVIKITNAGVGELVETDDFLPKSFLSKYESYRVIEGDLILALTRPYISTGLKISSCPPSYNNSLLNQRVAAIRVFLDTSFLYQYMQSAYVLGVYRERFGSSGLQPNLKMGDVTNLVIPVPPENEQQRIVAKVNELMALCDALKDLIQDAQTTQTHLADAIVEQAVA